MNPSRVLPICIVLTVVCFTTPHEVLAQEQNIIELSSPDERSYGFFGFSISSVPDTNGNRRDDVIINDDWKSYGRVYLFSGESGRLLRTLSAFDLQSNSLEFGRCVSGIPDVDGDDRGDIIVGAPRETILYFDDHYILVQEVGRTYLFSGSTGETIHVLESPNFEEYDWFGSAVSCIPDVDGDRRWDIVASAGGENPGGSSDGQGVVYLFSSSTGDLLQTLISPNIKYHDEFGTSVSGMPDVDGDKRGDLVVGGYRTPGGCYLSQLCIQECTAYVYSGGTGELLHTLVPPEGRVGDGYGTRVCGIEDLNGDGRGEVIVNAWPGSPGSSPSKEACAFVFSGSTGTVLHILDSPEDESAGGTVHALSGVPDRDGDGVGDIIVGSYNETSGDSPSGAGRVHIFSGSTGLHLQTLRSPNEEEYGYFGDAITGLKDVDRDGIGDLVVGAPGEGPGDSPSGAGRAYIFLSTPRVSSATPRLWILDGMGRVTILPSLNQ